ncbi:MAG: hypothetical protein K9G36_01645 [Crocinitomicaceae bacterium]|nr:hypothetical protein [Crocinitomicaceae bacterium]MCF8444259.1 hypothetical protein [Crocinitomicaceae bacterium]
MNKIKLIILSLVAFVFGLIMSQNISYSQSKKQQIEALNFKIDSVNQVIAIERNTQKTTISSLEIQESKSKQKVDSLTKVIKSIEQQISTKQNDKLTFKSEISRLKNEIEKLKDSLISLTKEEFKPQTNFNSVEIGNQTWMTQNLNVSTFRNGDPIPEARTNEEWEKAGKEGKPAWCYYDNDISNSSNYGKLYNWFAVNDPRGIAPEGWYIASFEEWKILSSYLGGEEISGKKLKSIELWKGVERGTNETGFFGVPGGARYYDGQFMNINEYGCWWTLTDFYVDTTQSRCFIMSFKGNHLSESFFTKSLGLSVRCIKKGSSFSKTKGSFIDSRDDNVYKTIIIGTQTWMAENLNESTFRNGDEIPEVKTNEEWIKAGEDGRPAWCYYDNDPKNGSKYGKLYNWYAVIDPRGLAPEGWHISNDAEWTIIENCLGVDAGMRMKNTIGWQNSEEKLPCNNCKSWNSEYQIKTVCNICKDTRINGTKTHSGNGSNTSGFSGLPGGFRNSNGSFSDIGNFGIWWSSTEFDITSANYRNLYYNLGLLGKGNFFKEFSFSVRCVKD